MTKQDIIHHEHMKERYSSYPKLPKALLTLFRKNRRNKNFHADLSIISHVSSVTRGFIGRVENWTKDHYPYLKIK